VAHPKRKQYRDGSPGQRRADEGLTLNAIKNDIRRSSRPNKARRDYIRGGLLGRGAGRR
jgi:hypothetical protein